MIRRLTILLILLANIIPTLGMMGASASCAEPSLVMCCGESRASSCCGCAGDDESACDDGQPTITADIHGPAAHQSHCVATDPWCRVVCSVLCRPERNANPSRPGLDKKNTTLELADTGREPSYLAPILPSRHAIRTEHPPASALYDTGRRLAQWCVRTI